MMESTEVRLARIEEGIVALRGDLKTYNGQMDRRMVTIENSNQKHHDHIIVLKRDRFWISGLAGVVASWLGLKLGGKI